MFWLTSAGQVTDELPTKSWGVGQPTLTARAATTPQLTATTLRMLHVRQVERISQVKRLRRKRRTVHLENARARRRSIRLE